MSREKWTIWTSKYDVDDFAEWLNEEHPEADEYRREELVCELNADYLDDERMNLGNIVAPNGIIVIASLGLWDGRRPGYKEIKNGKVSDCLYLRYDGGEFYCDKYNFCGVEYHHDGTNYYTYRVWKDGLSDRQKENFMNKILKGTVMSCDISRYTRSLRPEIAKVYGW